MSYYCTLKLHWLVVSSKDTHKSGLPCDVPTSRPKLPLLLASVGLYYTTLQRDCRIPYNPVPAFTIDEARLWSAIEIFQLWSKRPFRFCPSFVLVVSRRQYVTEAAGGLQALHSFITLSCYESFSRKFMFWNNTHCLSKKNAVLVRSRSSYSQCCAVVKQYSTRLTLNHRILTLVLNFDSTLWSDLTSHLSPE